MLYGELQNYKQILQFICIDTCISDFTEIPIK